MDMSDNHLWAVFWLCVTVMFVSVITGLIYYNLQKPNNEEIELQKLDIRMEMIKTYHINPAVLECINRSWASLPEYEICKNLFEKIDISPDEQNRIRSMLKDKDPVTK